MIYPIQDDALRRVLQFFGLRSITTPHDYDARVQPVVLVGDLGQPRAAITVASISVVSNLADFPVPPKDESWRLLFFCGLYTQSAGAAAGQLRFTIRDWGASAATVSLIPFSLDSTTILGEQTSHAIPLNTAQRFFAQPRTQPIIFPGQHIAANPTGDGTRTVSDLLIIVEKLGGVLQQLD